MNSTYDFIDFVIETLVSYHQDGGQELGMIHLGGDPAPPRAWVDSSACQELSYPSNGRTIRRCQTDQRILSIRI